MIIVDWVLVYCVIFICFFVINLFDCVVFVEDFDVFYVFELLINDCICNEVGMFEFVLFVECCYG